MPHANLILENAKVITMEPSLPVGEAIAVKDGRILAVGSRNAMRVLAGSGTKFIDCQGGTVVPGFIDAHCHLFSFIRKLLSLDLSPASVRCIADIKEKVRARAGETPEGAWISGTGMSDYYLAEKRLPNRKEIDAVSPHHPVVLAHAGLHQAVLNSWALNLAGMKKDGPVPEGATLERDATGELTGLTHELLGYIREVVMLPLSESELGEGMALVSKHYLSQGITSICDATIVNSLSRFNIFKRFKDRGILVPRVYMMFGYEFLNEFKEAGLAFRGGDEGLRLGGVKIIVTESTGSVYPDGEALGEMITRSEAAGFQVAIHAIQEQAILAVLDALEKSTHPELRHRIEHCFECSPEILERLRKLRPVVVTQPNFLYYGGDRTLAMQPQAKRPWFYRFRSISNLLTLAASSDSPVSGDYPVTGIYAALSRKTQSGQVINADEAITAYDALKMYGANAAYASFDEGLKGTIAPGKLADMVVLNGDPLTAPVDEIREMKVMMTVVGGRVYSW